MILGLESRHPLPIPPVGGSLTLSVVSGDTVYYGNDQDVSASSNLGALTAGGSSVTITAQVWVRTAGLSALNVFGSASPQDVVLGNDGTVGGPGGTPLTALVLSANPLLPSGGDDTAAINAAATAGRQLGAGVFRVSGIITGAVRGSGANTIIQATVAAAGVEHGPALPGAPLNTGHNDTAGGYVFDANNVATGGTKQCAVHTNTVDWHYEPISVINVPAGVDAFSICGQNCGYEELEVGVPDQAGGFFGLFFDNGAGSNTISSMHTNGAALDYRETVGTHGYGYPEHNLIERWVADQYTITTSTPYVIRHRAGAWNTIQNAEIQAPPSAPSIVKFEAMTLPAGVGGGVATNGRLICQGKCAWIGAGAGVVGGGQYWVWADFSSNGGTSAGGMNGDIGIQFSGAQTIAGVDGEFKWGTTTPALGLFVDVQRFGSNAGTRPFWTVSGSGASAGPGGAWRVQGKLAIGGLPDQTVADTLQVVGSGNFTGTTSSKFRSGSGTQSLTVSLGRTSDEAQVAAVGAINNFFSGTAAGDAVLRLADVTKKLHVGVDAGAAAAELIISDGALAMNGPLDLATHRITSVSSPQADSDAANRGWASQDPWRPATAKVENYSRKGRKLNTGLALASGVLYLTGGFLVLQGTVITGACFYGANTQMAGGTHLWYGLYDLSGTFLRNTADQTTAAPLTKGQGLKLPFTSTWTAPADTAVYAGIAAVATTMPDLLGADAPGGSTLYTDSPLLASAFLTAQTVPSSSNAGSATASVIIHPYAYLY